jgi:methylenetetrahydrofolate reductase (NADPH)
MKVTEHIAKADKTLFTIEILPPIKGDSIETIYSTIDPLLEFKPAFIDVTYHREEIVFKERAKGLLEKKVVRKRPGTVGISAAIKFKYGVDVVPHIICGGFSREETENGLIDLDFLGIHNLLVMRGDNLKTEKSFQAEPDGHSFAIDLVKQIIDMNNGKYIDDGLLGAAPTNFIVGVTGYPEKHLEAPNLHTDIQFLKAKIDAGAEYIVTQMFFDNSKYFEFVRICRESGITVPIIPGIKPLSTINQMVTLPRTFNIDLPDDLVSEVQKCKNNEQARAVGIEWCIAQSKELITFGVPVLHYFTMGKPDNIKKVAEAIF